MEWQSFRPPQRHHFPSPETLLTVGFYLALLLLLVWGFVGFLAAP